MKFNIFKYSVAALFFTFMISCQKGLLNTFPKDKLSSATFWKTKSDAINAVNAIYSFLPGVSEMQWDMISDIATTNTTYASTVTIEKGEHDASLDFFESQWKNAYKAIRASNYFLEHVDAVKESDPQLTDDLINRLKGEARFIRAFYYTRLVMLFGDVPLITKTLTIAEGKEVGRTPVREVWDFIDQELTQISDGLPLSYTGDDIGRITQGAALAMDARAMLYAGRWERASALAKEVMDLHVYSLDPSYKNLFTYAGEDSKEIILARQYARDVAANNFFAAYAPHGMNGGVGICPTQTLVSSYETINGVMPEKDPSWDPKDPYKNRDPRLDYTLFLPAFSDHSMADLLYNGIRYDPRPGSGTADEVEVDYLRTKTGFNTQKYIQAEDMADRGNCGTNFILIRYADVLLMYAEAKIEMNQPDQSVYDAINAVRQRTDVKLPAITSGKTQDSLRAIVRHEREVELAMEGLRFFDIRRWKTADQYMHGPIPGMRYIKSGKTEVDTLFYRGVVRSFNPARDYLFPIPQQERVLDKKLTQNPEY